MLCLFLIAPIRQKVLNLVVFFFACAGLQAQQFTSQLKFTPDSFAKSDLVLVYAIAFDQTPRFKPTQFSEKKTPATNLTADQHNLFQIKTDSSLNYQKYYPPKKADFKKLGYCTMVFVGTSVVVAAVVWTLPESASGWDKEEIKNTGLFNMWLENVTAGPIVDEDSDFFNYITHPYAGAVYYMAARSSGFKPLGSFAYSVIASTLIWEYGIEAFAEIPSWQDLIITPTLGSLLGEAFFFAKSSILKNDSRVLKSKALGFACLLLMDPFSTAVDGFGYKPKTTSTVTMTPIPYSSSNKTAPALGLKYTIRF